MLCRELATLRMHLMESGIRGSADAGDLERLRAEIERLAADLRRSGERLWPA